MRHIITLFLALTVTAVTAQNDMKARALVEQTSKKMQSFQTLTASFTFTMENAKMKIKEQNSGSLLLKGAKYQVKLPEMGMQIFCDGKTVWNLMEEAGQVTVSNAGEGSEGVIDPTTIFNIYQEGYTFKTAEEKTVGGKQITYIEMVPQKNNTDYTKLTVGIDKAKLLVSSLVTHGKDGNLYGIYVNDIKSNQPVADTEFVFNKAKFPGIEVVDFR